MNWYKKEKVVNCPISPKEPCMKDKCGIWITVNNGGMCSVSLIATSLKGIFTLLKKGKSEIDLYFEKQEQELGLTNTDNKEGEPK